MSLPKNLKEARTNAQLTQVRLSAASRVPQGAISLYEKGEHLPDLTTVLRLAVGLQLPLDDLVRGLDEEYDEVVRQKTSRGVEIDKRDHRNEGISNGPPTTVTPDTKDPNVQHLQNTTVAEIIEAFRSVVAEQARITVHLRDAAQALDTYAKGFAQRIGRIAAAAPADQATTTRVVSSPKPPDVQRDGRRRTGKHRRK